MAITTTTTASSTGGPAPAFFLLHFFGAECRIILPRPRHCTSHDKKWHIPQISRTDKQQQGNRVGHIQKQRVLSPSQSAWYMAGLHQTKLNVVCWCMVAMMTNRQRLSFLPPCDDKYSLGRSISSTNVFRRKRMSSTLEEESAR